MSQSQPRAPYRLHRPGGDMDNGRIFNAPGVVLALVGATIAVFVILALAPARTTYAVLHVGAVSAAKLEQAAANRDSLSTLISPFIGHMFIHGGPLHLFFNCVWLLAFGAPIARRMGAEGALRSISSMLSAMIFLLFYFLAGAAGALLFIAFHLGQSTLLIGASGGVFGLLGGLVRFAFNRTSLLGPEYALISPLFSAPVMMASMVILSLNFASAVFLTGALDSANVAWEAHMGGFVFGLVAYPLFERIARA